MTQQDKPQEHDPLATLIVKFVDKKRAEWRLYPDLWADELAAKIRAKLEDEAVSEPKATEFIEED
jgi:hypothetical protein